MEHVHTLFKNGYGETDMLVQKKWERELDKVLKQIEASSIEAEEALAAALNSDDVASARIGREFINALQAIPQSITNISQAVALGIERSNAILKLYTETVGYVGRVARDVSATDPSDDLLAVSKAADDLVKSVLGA